MVQQVFPAAELKKSAGPVVVAAGEVRVSQVAPNRMEEFEIGYGSATELFDSFTGPQWTRPGGHHGRSTALSDPCVMEIDSF